MATAITVTDANGPNPTDGTTITMTAADVASGNEFTLTGRELLIAHNTSTTAARSVSIDAVADPFNRGGADQISADSIAIGAIHLYGPFSLLGWRQTDGTLQFSADNAEVAFGVLRF